MQDVGMGSDNDVDERASVFASLSPKRGVEIFEEILGTDGTR
jgi:hypothetical protein